MKIEWDFKELTDFGDNLKSFSSVFDKNLQRATKEIAHTLLQYMRELTPRDKKGKLIDGWNGQAFLVKPTSNGYEVELVNKTEYASWVNDGHRAFNQYGGPYKIHNRVKVTSPHPWQKGSPTYYVFGHFFVERGILQLCNTDQIEKIVYKHLQNWWKGL
jgi:hypothetical protein